VASPDSLIQIAKVLKSFGTDGGVLLGFRDVMPEDIDPQEPVFIEFDGLPVPFFFDSFSRKGRDKAIVHLTDVSSLEDAEELVGRAVLAEEDSVAGWDEDEGPSLDDFVGLVLFNRDARVGEITDYEDIPGNPCLYVDTENGQAMIPLHEDFILSVDPEAGEIVMDLPDGLV
jgi:16S rRNA processing protein RimM